MRIVRQACIAGGARDHFQHLGAVTAMHHAVEVVRPARRAFAPVGQRHADFVRQCFATPVHCGVGDVEHRHGVGVKAQLVVAHDGADAPQRALVQPLLQRRQHRGGRAAQGPAPNGRRAWHQWQARFEQGRQRAVGLGHWRGLEGGGHGGPGRAAAQVEAQVDAVGALHAQLQGGESRGIFEQRHGTAHRGIVVARHHEPQVVAVLALVVVVYTGVAGDDGGHGVQPLGRHGHGGQQRSAPALPANTPPMRLSAPSCCSRV